MYKLRAKIAEDTEMKLLIHKNPEALNKRINPFDHGSRAYRYVENRRFEASFKSWKI